METRRGEIRHEWEVKLDQLRETSYYKRSIGHQMSIEKSLTANGDDIIVPLLIK